MSRAAPPDAPDAERLGWLRLARCPGLSVREAHALGAAFGGAAFATGAPHHDDAARVGPRLRARLADAELDARVRAECERARAAGWLILHPRDERYPRPLAGIDVPPAVLSVAGDAAALAGPGVAIVGSRRPSGYGLRLAEELAGGLAAVGVVVISGLAQGIDGAAHRAALATGGRTIAVMGTGLDKVYPRHHGSLAREIASRGALVTEFPPGVPPLADHFPRRNRVIAGLADAVVVVEAGPKSGALITARWATDFSRPVLAVPGRAGDLLATGTLALLRDGAALACTLADVLLELPPDRQPPGLAAAALGQAAEPRTPTADGAAGAVLELLPRDDDRHLDELLEASALPPEEVLSALFSLEIGGIVEALPGRRYRRARGTAKGTAV